MEYEVTELPHATILRPQGDLSAQHDGELRKALVGLIGDKSANIVVDMRKVTFMDSTIIGTLVWGMKNVRESGGDVRLFGLHDFVQKLFTITLLDKAFKIFDSESEAVESYSG